MSNLRKFHCPHLLEVRFFRGFLDQFCCMTFIFFLLATMLRQGLPPPHCLPPLTLPSTRGVSSTLRQRAPIPSRGGQLQVAGVVVGQWGANYGYQRQQLMPAGMNPGGGYPPHPGSGRGRGGNGRGGRGGNNTGRKPGPPTYHTNPRRQVSVFCL